LEGAGDKLEECPRYVEKPLDVAVMARAMEFYSLDVTEGVEEALAKGMDRLTLVLTSVKNPMAIILPLWFSHPFCFLLGYH
jgi:hypothetical protein